MPATVTLTTTTLDVTLDASTDRVKLASTSGVRPSMRLFMDGELMTVRDVSLSPWVTVTRGVDGTKALPHASAVTVYAGNADQFYQKDPTGRPGDAIAISPWINTRTGGIWFAQGDNEPVATADRWWQLQQTTYDQGPLGVRVKTPNPTSSI